MTTLYSTECVNCGSKGLLNLVPHPFYSPATVRNSTTGGEEPLFAVCAWGMRCKACYNHYGVYRETEEELWDSYEKENK